MLFSVVIPTYNRVQALERTLAALRSQTLCQSAPSRLHTGRATREEELTDNQSANQEPPFEILVVDDGSTDSTEDLVKRFERDYPVPLRYLQQANRKQGSARNLGSQQAEGEFLVFLGDDTVPAPSFLEEHARARSKPRIDPCSSRLVVIGYTPWPQEYRQTRFMRYIVEEGWQFGFSLIQDPEDISFNFFYTSNLSISRSFFWESGGFDESFQEYGWEDIELGHRLQQLGMHLVFHREAIAYHHHPTSLESFVQRQRKVGSSAWRFYQMHPQLDSFLNVRSVPRYSGFTRLKMGALSWLCRLTEAWSWPDLSRYYPDLMSYHYNLGILQARNE